VSTTLDALARNRLGQLRIVDGQWCEGFLRADKRVVPGDVGGKIATDSPK